MLCYESHLVSNDRDKKKMEIKAATRRSLLSGSKCVPSELVDFTSSEETHSLLDSNDRLAAALISILVLSLSF